MRYYLILFLLFASLSFSCSDEINTDKNNLDRIECSFEIEINRAPVKFSCYGNKFHNEKDTIYYKFTVVSSSTDTITGRLTMKPSPNNPQINVLHFYWDGDMMYKNSKDKYFSKSMVFTYNPKTGDLIDVLDDTSLRNIGTVEQGGVIRECFVSLATMFYVNS